MPAPRKYTQETRQRAVRAVLDARRVDSGLTLGAAVTQVGRQVRVPAATLRKWVQQDEAVVSAPPSLVVASASGDRLTALRALRDVVAVSIAGTDSARDVAALSARLMDVLAQIEAAEKAAPEEKGTPLDELEKRRAARQSGSSHRPRSEGGVVAR